MQAEPPDAVVAIGGGSALDLAKAARSAHSQGTPFARLLAGADAVAEPCIGLVTVPTTSGTGSEVSGGAVVVDRETGRKLGVASPLMRAQHALVDPLLTLGLPPAATMGTGADALAQAIGGVIVRNGNPGSVALGLEACRHVAAGLRHFEDALLLVQLPLQPGGPLDRGGVERLGRTRGTDRSQEHGCNYPSELTRNGHGSSR